MIGGSPATAMGALVVGALLCVTPALAQPAGGGPATGRYECWAAGGVAGTLNLEITGPSSYAGNGKAGDYTFSPENGRITFSSGPWAGFYGKLLGPTKIGISSRPGGSSNTVCDRK